MSVLIDLLMEDIKTRCVETQVNGRWYIAKPCDMKGMPGFITRVRDSIKVLLGKARAYHYKEDTL